MTNIIEAIEAKLQAQKDEIFFKEMQIKDLKERLETAEKEKAELMTEIELLIKRVDAQIVSHKHEVKGATK